MLKLTVVPSKETGFRLSVIDIVFIALSISATYILYPYLLLFVWIIPLVVFHFFLFCNVFRVRRNLELLWAAIFCANVIMHFHVFHFSWKTILLIQIPTTLVIIIIQICDINYRGIFSKKKEKHGSLLQK